VSLFDHRIDQAGGPDATQFKQKDSLLVEPLPDPLHISNLKKILHPALRRLWNEVSEFKQIVFESTSTHGTAPSVKKAIGRQYAPSL
ncbi:hypothetical protein, partial [Salinibacter ruber]|uniref:hypothetical protein n=1 Tax=Salinibacter ruber TaxID=146919 RepID=UPI0021683444